MATPLTPQKLAQPVGPPTTPASTTSAVSPMMAVAPGTTPTRTTACPPTTPDSLRNVSPIVALPTEESPDARQQRQSAITLLRNRNDPSSSSTVSASRRLSLEEEGDRVMLVEFDVAVALPGYAVLTKGRRTFQALVPLSRRQEPRYDQIVRQLAGFVTSNLGAFGDYDREGLPEIYFDPERDWEPDINIRGIAFELTDNDMVHILAAGSTNADRRNLLRRDENFFTHRRMFNDFFPNAQRSQQHDTFTHYIPGSTGRIILTLMPPEMQHSHHDCERMCAYRMIRDNNPSTRNLTVPRRDCRPEAVHALLREKFPDLGEITDGLAPIHIEAFCKHHKVPMVAMDITNHAHLMYMPERHQRHKNMKSIFYVGVEDHCYPIVDQEMVQRIAQLITRMEQRKITIRNWNSVSLPMSGRGAVDQRQARKRGRSLDRSPSYPVDRSNATQASQRCLAMETHTDVEIDDRLDDLDGGRDDHGNVLNFDVDGQSDVAQERKRRIYPKVTETQYFHFFTYEKNKKLIEEKLHADYQEGDDKRRIHFYICTDEKDVEKLYQYCLRKLSWNPGLAARHINGKCRNIWIKNVVWIADPEIHHYLRLHQLFFPEVPFQQRRIASLAYECLNLCIQQRSNGRRHITNLMSIYSPNMQRLMDDFNPYNKPKLLQHTWKPPYSNLEEDRQNLSREDLPPKDGIEQLHKNPIRPMDKEDPSHLVTVDDLRAELQQPRELIPQAERRRIDRTRSYSAALHRFVQEHVEFPIHSLTDVVVDYDESKHGSIPMGHYLVRVPSKQEMKNRNIEDQWTILTWASPEKQIMMSYWNVQQFLKRNLLVKTDILKVCLVDNYVKRNFTMLLLESMGEYLRKIYQHTQLQTSGDPATKTLINQLIGLCNGTTMPYSGNRYVFKDFKECLQIKYQLYGEDPHCQIKCMEVRGQDPDWDNVTYQYYTMNTSGVSHTPFHLQPIYNMILEEQSLAMYDMLRHIPIPNLIQVNIDAIEYQVPPLEESSKWAQYVESLTIDVDTYQRCTPAILLDQGFLGMFKPEKLKGPELWKRYYYHYGQVREEKHINRVLWNRTVQHYGPLPTPTEDYEVVPDWKGSMRLHKPEYRVREDGYITEMVVQWLQDKNKSGLLVTGAAGTGKTHLIRALRQAAENMGIATIVQTAYTHAACVQQGQGAVTLCSLFGLQDPDGGSNRALLARSRKFASMLRALNIDLLIIDEISMIPYDILECLRLYHLHSPKTRIILSGDFHQLPPVEARWKDSTTWQTPRYNYFDNTDIFPWLTYDFVTNTHGQWWHLTECMRANDPLLQEVCLNPDGVHKIDISPFLLTANTLRPWRYICATNVVRVAVNAYLGEMWLRENPDAKRYEFDLHDIYADFKMNERSTAQRRTTNKNKITFFKELDELMARHYTKNKEARDKAKNSPNHWQYLQKFVYAEGMEVVCRNTLRYDVSNQKTEKDSVELTTVVNNRRAIITEIDKDNKQITLLWYDKKDNTNDENREVTLSIYDFAFNFVPGFCITAHMAQGETIKGPYGILQWDDMCGDPRMAYVALTRGTCHENVRIVDRNARDPWNTTTTNDPFMNVMRELYQLTAYDYSFKMPAYLRPTNWAAMITDMITMQRPIPLSILRPTQQQINQYDALVASGPSDPFCSHCLQSVLCTGYQPGDTSPKLFRLAAVVSDLSRGEGHCVAMAYPCIVCRQCHSIVQNKRHQSEPDLVE